MPQARFGVRFRNDSLSWTVQPVEPAVSTMPLERLSDATFEPATTAVQLSTWIPYTFENVATLCVTVILLDRLVSSMPANSVRVTVNPSITTHERPGT